MAPKIGTKSVNLFPDQALSNTLNMIINANKNASENNYESEDQFNAESAKLLMLTLSNLFSLQNETTCEWFYKVSGRYMCSTQQV